MIFQRDYGGKLVLSNCTRNLAFVTRVQTTSVRCSANNQLFEIYSDINCIRYFHTGVDENYSLKRKWSSTLRECKHSDMSNIYIWAKHKPNMLGINIWANIKGNKEMWYSDNKLNKVKQRVKRFEQKRIQFLKIPQTLLTPHPSPPPRKLWNPFPLEF